MARPTSSIEKKVRIQKVFTMIVDARSTATIVEFCKKEYKVSFQTVYSYIKEADVFVAETLFAECVVKLSRAVAQREKLIEKLIDDGSYTAAGQLMMDREKLFGLYEATKQDTNITIKVQ